MSGTGTQTTKHPGKKGQHHTQHGYFSQIEHDSWIILPENSCAEKKNICYSLFFLNLSCPF
jgi:hypothetical protein